MAFDTATRNELQKLVGRARGLLVDEFMSQCQGVYGIQPDGSALEISNLGHLSEEDRTKAGLLRDRVNHLAAGIAGSKKRAEAVARVVREQAFTVLNRLCALRMCEERGLVQECVRSGYDSKGFRLYDQAASRLGGDTYSRYRLFLQLLFDELAIDLGVLFDRFSPYGLLFPRENALKELLQQINTPALTHIWAEDEAIGWVYQYFNSQEERQAMRKASAAPRNSRELAVRNQFFTPRYVVEFLTDNTLGRIWYEMRQGNTALKEACAYLVRRPAEIFLREEEPPPKNDDDEAELLDEERLKRPVYIAHREKKDPRDIRVLDPACGSGHFLLYAFDLLEAIYREAWADPDSPESEVTGSCLREDYTSLEELKKLIPELILRWNLHGIDIDPRAAQIAALSLWLRAQKAWQSQGLGAGERPQIRRSNIVCAEPMPGEKDLLRDFSSQLKPRVLGQLLEVVFSQMQLAGEAGSLLRIEEEIQAAIETARQQWLAGPKPEQEELFPNTGKPKQAEMRFDFSGVTRDSFWTQAEEKILKSLEEYAKETLGSDGMGRRLFSEDAAQGFAFIDLCRKRYDSVLMNPPFGDRILSCDKLFRAEYGHGKLDLYHYFYERAEELLLKNGRLGAITPRTLLYQSRYGALRKKWLTTKFSPIALAELDLGVLDSATVRPLLVVLGRSPAESNVFYKNLKHSNVPSTELLDAIQEFCRGKLTLGSTYHVISRFAAMPGERMAFWAPGAILDCFSKFPTLEPDFGKVTEGLSNEDDLRFLRCWWEVPVDHSEQWRPYGKFDSRSTYVPDFSIVIDWSPAGYFALGERGNRRANERYYFEAGIAFTRSCEVGMAATSLPRNVVFSGVSRYFLQDEEIRFGLLAYLNTRFAEGLHLVLTPDRDRISGTLRKIPVVIDQSALEAIGEIGAVVWKRKFEWLTVSDETHRQYLDLLSSLRKEATLKQREVTVSKIKSEIEKVERSIEDRLEDSLFFAVEDLKVVKDEVEERAGERDLVSWNRDISNEYSGGALLVSCCIGVAFGRWDIRFAIGSKKVNGQPDPFAPLPLCPPGQLLNDDGLPITKNDAVRMKKKGLWDYPIDVAWEGILADDEGHPYDLISRIRLVLKTVWEDRWEATEREVCDILSVSALGDYLRKPRRFFADHLARYSKSRRKAPIYWPLSTESGKYTLWVYYPRITDQTLYSCVNDFIDPKLEEIKRDVSRVRNNRDVDRGTQKQLDDLVELQREISAMRDELLRVAKLSYKPNQNDGVLISAAPLWRLFHHKAWQKDLKKCWDELETGKYDWTHLAYAMWPERVREACKKDKSIAIARGLEELYEG